MRKVIRAFVDRDSFFEIKERFGRSITTALARLDGRTIGVIANNPQFKGGAIDADACSKATDFIVLCDSYNVPLVFLQDQPGFLIGPEAEKRGIIGQVINWMNALLQVTVPRISIILRKSYGRGFINMGGAGDRRRDRRVVDRGGELHESAHGGDGGARREGGGRPRAFRRSAQGNGAQRLGLRSAARCSA